MSAKTFFTHPLGILLSAIAATFLWGSALPFIKKSYLELGIANDDLFAQFVFAGYRFVLAAVLILLFMKMVGRSIALQKRNLLSVVKVSSAQTFFQYVFFYVGIGLSTGIQGSIISGTTTFFQIIVAYFLFKGDTITFRKVVGMCIGFVGVIVVNMSQGELTLHFGLGEILLLIAMFFGGLGNVLAKREAQKMELMNMTAYQMLLGGLGLLGIGALGVGIVPFTFNFTAFLILLYLSFISAVSFVVWNSVMKYNSVGTVSIYLFLIPVFGVFLSTLILGEQLSILIFAALSLVAVGIVIVNREDSSKKKLAARKEIKGT